jgi:hypothetical protein
MTSSMPRPCFIIHSQSFQQERSAWQFERPCLFQQVPGGKRDACRASQHGRKLQVLQLYVVRAPKHDLPQQFQDLQGFEMRYMQEKSSGVQMPCL